MDVGVLARVCITDRSIAERGDLLSATRRAISARGATMVIVRELDFPRASQIAMARMLRTLLPTGRPLLSARDPEAAAEADVDGVHLGWNSPSEAEARRILGPGRIVGRSVHSVAEAVAAAAAGADFVMFGPVEATPKHGRTVAPAGWDAVREVVAATSVPVVLVGGLGPEDEDRARAAGAAGVAGIRAFMSP
jgi:thiamine-phosphate pyrophosphorylase